MQRYRRLVLGSLLGIAVMIGVGLASLATTQQEIFPFYSWFLFALVPNTNVTYQVFLHRVGGTVLPQPRPYNQADALIPGARSITAYKVIQRLGRACVEGDATEVLQQRFLLESHMPPGTRYEVAAVRADPIAEWREHRLMEHRPLQYFDRP